MIITFRQALISLFILSSQRSVAQGHKSQPIDSTPAVLNIYIRYVMHDAALNLPVVGPAIITTRRASLRPKSRTAPHYFHRIEMLDSGQLRYQVAIGNQAGFLHTPLRVTMRPKLPIDSVFVPRGEHWLVLESVSWSFNRLNKGNYNLLKSEEFARLYPRAYRRFEQGGYHLIFKHVPPNTDPKPVPYKRTTIVPTLHPKP